MLQEVALSTTEAEYCAISMSLRDVIFLMNLLEETARELPWETSKERPKVHCKLFEDNSGALEMARLPKMRPRTKHLCVKMHHFREYVRQGKVSIHKIPTRFQLGDIATKAQPEPLFVSQRESLLQWDAETMTTEELALPATHLRACDISDKSEDLCMDQHANAFSVSQHQSVAEHGLAGTMTGIMPLGDAMTEEMPANGQYKQKRGRRANSSSQSVKSEVSRRLGKDTEGEMPRRNEASHGHLISSKASSPPLLSVEELLSWIKDKGFDGKTTKRQRELRAELERLAVQGCDSTVL
jgi:hypothetical protein